MSFKDISYLELWQPFCSAERNLLCNIDSIYYEDQFCEMILNLDQWFRRRCLLKIFNIWSSGNHFVRQRGSICAILVDGIKRKNSVNLFQILADGSGEDVTLKISYLELWWSSFSVEWNHL